MEVVIKIKDTEIEVKWKMNIIIPGTLHWHKKKKIITPRLKDWYSIKGIQPSMRCDKSLNDYEPCLTDVFLHETPRKLNGYSTLMIKNILFDVLLIYIGTSIIIRYEHKKIEHVYMYDTLNTKNIY